jgi:hypothetical protein
VLPFTKRPYRSPEASELINTDEIQVFAGSSAGIASDDARTVVYSGSRKSTKSAKSANPPADLAAGTVTIPKPAPLPKMDRIGEKTNLRGLMRPVRDDERTMLRPLTPVPSKPTRSSPTNLTTPYVPSATPFAMTAVASAHDSIRPVSITKDADSLPLGTVITQKTQLGRKPGMSWAAALMAVGVFLGLVTAVIARGDADALIEATASFVDPSHVAARPTGGQATQAAAGAALLPGASPKHDVPVIQITPPEPPPAAPVLAAPATPVVASPIVTPPPVVAIPVNTGSKSIKPAAALHASKIAAAASAKPATSAQKPDKPEVPAANAQGLTRRADEELEGVMRAIGH